MRNLLSGAILILLTGVFSEMCQGKPPAASLVPPKKDSVFLSKLPLIIINTGHKKIRDNKKVNAGMGIIFKGVGFYNRDSDPFNHFDGNINIEVRGSSSKSFPKKSYSMQTVDEVGRSRYVSLLGLPSECDWILYAPYNDKTLMRDVLAYRLSRDMDRYATNAVYVELILNGKYQGVYILEEKIKGSPVRININASSKVRSPIQDGFILRIDKPRDGSRLFDGRTMASIVGKSRKIVLNKKAPKSAGTKMPNICSEARDLYFNSAYVPTGSKWQTVKFNFYEPKPETLTEQNRLDMCNFMHLMESSMHDPFTMSMDSGYHNYLDMESFVDYFIINEVTKNMDGYRLSTYFYKGTTNKGKISMGPPWDYNISMGNVDYCEGYLPTGWAYKFNDICPNDAYLVPFWWERLLDDPLFRDHLKCRWNELRKNSFSTDNVMYVIDSISNSLNDSPSRNFKRWNVLGKDIWPNKFVFKSYTEEVTFLKSWLTERLEWLDRNMPGNCPALNHGDSRSQF